MATCVNDFGARRLPLSSLVDFINGLMDNTNPKIRAGAISLLGALYKQTGGNIKLMEKLSFGASTMPNCLKSFGFLY